jgi:hypothetical protein
MSFNPAARFSRPPVDHRSEVGGLRVSTRPQGFYVTMVAEEERRMD